MTLELRLEKEAIARAEDRMGELMFLQQVAASPNEQIPSPMKVSTEGDVMDECAFYFRVQIQEKGRYTEKTFPSFREAISYIRGVQAGIVYATKSEIVLAHVLGVQFQ